MYELNVHSICMSIILFDIAIKYFWKTWKKSGKIMEFQNENLVATLIYAAWHIEIAASSNFVASSSVVVVCRRHTLYSGQYLKNGLMDSIQIWHVVVTTFEGVLYCKVTLNSHV